MIRVKCDCGATFNAKDDRAGKVFKCSECGKSLRVPKPEMDSSPVPAADQPIAKSTTTGGFIKVLLPVAAVAGILIAFTFWLSADRKEESPKQEDSANNAQSEPESPTPDVQSVVIQEHAEVTEEKEAVETKHEQAVVTFPAKRQFTHGMLIRTNTVDDNLEIRQLTMKTDEGLGMVMFHFSLEKDASGNLTVHNIGSFGFFSYEKNWSKLYPEKLGIVIDGEAVFQKCRRSDELIIAEFHLLDYERMLNANAITFEVGTVKFNLTSRHIEAMKELASGLPDGDTKGKWCVIRHEPDTVGKIDDPLLTTVDRDEALQVEQTPNDIGSLSSEQNLKAESIKQGDKNAASMPSAAMLKRSKTNLDSAKKLLKSRKDVAAKKLLEKAINDAPKSESGKEAAKILKSLR